ncbi:MAG: winged helix-turn-helix domain-containing protein [Myxococcales bacterium]|nr:winged helix-turn-helix domain-containing protein [Myxococcales bacterium]
MLRVGRARVDLVHRTVRRDDGAQLALTGHEAEAVTHLARHLGEVVDRSALEREVWGMSAATRSEAVPVAMRRLRKKLGPEALVTVRGRGWKLVPAAPEPQVTPQPLLAPPGPLLGRDALVAQVERSLTSEVRWLTLHGPPAVGTTRIAHAVARRASDRCRVVAVDLDGATSSDVILRVADALALGRATAESLVTALAAHPTLVVLDDADGVDALVVLVTTWLARAPELQVLSTQHHAPTTPDQLGLAVPPLDGDAARDLLVLHLRAVLPGVREDDPLLDAVLTHLDGLPGAIELWAARGGLGLGALLQELRSGDDPLRDRVTRMVSGLHAPEERALRAAAAFAGPFTLDDARAVLGDVAPLHALRSQHLLQPTEDGRLFVLRAVARTLTDPPDELRARVHAQVLTRAEQAAHTLQSEPATALTTLRSLRSALLSIVDTATADDAARAVAALTASLRLTGPAEMLIDAIRRFDARDLQPEQDHGLAVGRAVASRLQARDAREQLALLQDRPEPDAALVRAPALARAGRAEAAQAELGELVARLPERHPARIEACYRATLSDVRGALREGLAESLLAQAVTEARDAGFPLLLQRALVASAGEALPDPDRALPFLYEALRLQDTIGVVTTTTLEAWSLLGVVHAESDPRTAVVAWRQAEALAQVGGVDDRMIALNLMHAYLELDEPERSLQVGPAERYAGTPVLLVIWQTLRSVALIAAAREAEGQSLQLQIHWPTLGLPVTADAAAYGHAVRAMVQAEPDRLRLRAADPSAAPAVRAALAASEQARALPRGSLARCLGRRLRAALDAAQ